MATPAPAIDYAAVRKGLVAFLSAATGLVNGRFILAQAQGPIQPVPKRPYATFQFRMTALKANFRDYTTPVPDSLTGAVCYAGHRGVALDVTFHGRTQDEAYGLAVNCQAGLYRPDLLGPLTSIGWAVYTIGDVTDLTALLNTGFEPRAMCEFEMWTKIKTIVEPGYIESVPLVGDVVTGLALTV